MHLAAGTRLGPYQIVALVGTGGMGEVYRARDTRLDRDVAVKVLPSALSADPDRLRRFELEARAASALSHPNILTIFDVGAGDGAPYVVSELLEGQTLRERLAGGALPARKAVDFGSQIAQGLAAAHDKGIVHRDLKPENVFVTAGGRVKILDFGLAKLTVPAEDARSAAPTLTRHTEPGTRLGTVGYMSPEQVRGKPADHRSDIFSLGVLLYEMLSGQPPFRGEADVETMNAILTEEPAELSPPGPSPSPALDRIVRHCLEKRPEERFQSARDLAFDLGALIHGSGSAFVTPAAGPLSSPLRAATWALFAVVLAAGALWLGLHLGRTPIPSFRQLTFHRGTVESARFSPDGNTVLYSAAWGGGAAEIFSMRLDGVDSRRLGFPPARVLGTAPGEMAILLSRTPDTGTLARVPLDGGVPREVLDDVQDADWTPDGARFAVVRRGSGRTQLEFPVGKLVYETGGDIDSPRVSPKADRVAFIDQPMQGNTPGSLVVVDADGRKQTLSEGWTDAGGVAWSPGGDEVWFSAARGGTARGLHAVTLSGRYRAVTRTPSAMILQDISRAGRLLFTHTHQRCEVLGHLRGETAERSLSWFDWTHASDLSADGQSLLFTAEGEAGGSLYTVYLRRTLDSAPVRLGEGHATELSPDGSWALTMLLTSPPRLTLLPTGAGQPRNLPREDGIAEYHWAWWFPDGKRILFLANKAGRPPQLFVQDVSDETRRPLTPEGVTTYRHKPISPDGRFVVVLVPGEPRGHFALWPVAGGEPRPLAGLAPGDRPLRWSGDGRYLFVRSPGARLPVRIDRLELLTSARTPWKEIAPADPAGVMATGDILLSPDGESVVISYQTALSELYVAEGLR